MKTAKKRASRPYRNSRVRRELNALGNLNLPIRILLNSSTTGLPISEITPATSIYAKMLRKYQKRYTSTAMPIRISILRRVVFIELNDQGLQIK
jgi:hypothetical protein